MDFIHLSSDGFHLILSAFIQTKKFNLLIDTGASKTVLDKNEFVLNFPELPIFRREELSTGLGTDSMESASAFIPQFQIGNLRIRNFEIALLDLTHIQNAYKNMNLNPISGVLGNDILVPYKAIIHYPKKRIRLFEPEPLRF